MLFPWSIDAYQPPASACNAERQARDKELDGLASLDYHERLTRFIDGSTKRTTLDSVNVVDFRPLYAANTHHLQRQLIGEIQLFSTATTNDDQMSRLNRLLQEYTAALRDFEFIHSNRWNTSFVKNIAASRIDDGPGSRLQRAMIDDAKLWAPRGTLPTLGRDPTEPPGQHHYHPRQEAFYTDADLLGSFDYTLMQQSNNQAWITRGSQLEREQTANRKRDASLLALRRLTYAVMGGLAVVVPVLTIVADAAVPMKTLVVVPAAICIFSIFTALSSNVSPESLLAATAAYSAVLMVFLGNYGLPNSDGGR